MPRPGGRRTRAPMQRKPPSGRFRQSQMLTTYGAGALVDLIDHAVLVGGLDFWRLPEGGEPIDEPRLRAELAPKLFQLGRPLSLDRPFIAPPRGDEENAHESVGVQVAEFPRWFVCQNAACRALVGAGSLELVNDRYVHHCSGAERKSERCVPVRFVVTCPDGHLSDVDWPRWAHRGKSCPAGAHNLRLNEGVTGDFSEISVSCISCKMPARPLKDLTVEEQNFPCTAERPWLGPEGKEEKCLHKQRMVVRTASNTYFAQTVSAVSIPELPSLRGAVQRVWSVLKDATPENIDVLLTLGMVKEAVGTASAAEVLTAITAIREGSEEKPPPLKLTEFKQFLSSRLEMPGEIPGDSPEERRFWSRQYQPPEGLPRGIGRLVIARRLREVVTSVGFTRLEPQVLSLSGELDLDVRSAALALQRDWLPAIEILGEGFFIQLDEDALRAWEKQPAVVAREKMLREGFDQWAQANDSKLEFPGARFYLLHSLSHLLLTQLSLECGYPASSIKERLYCSPGGSAVPMAAVLLSTGTTGSEGTLGGLVEEGRRLGHHLSLALPEAKLCSNDPVCAHHAPADSSGRCLEGAACHGCLYLPETSCERFNQFLDRALVVSTLGVDGAAFFS